MTIPCSRPAWTVPSAGFARCPSLLFGRVCDQRATVRITFVVSGTEGQQGRIACDDCAESIVGQMVRDQVIGSFTLGRLAM